MAKKKKKRVLKVKNILILLGIVLGITSIIYYALIMPIKNIYIEGNSILSDNEIIELSTLSNYPSFLLTKSTDIKNKLKSNPYIENVKIKKKLGNIIELHIKEYTPICINANQLILSNRNKLDNTYNLSDIPTLTNEIEDKKIYQKFVKKFTIIDKNILRQISEIEYQPVEVDKERFLLYMNDGNLVYITLTKINTLNKYNQIKDKLENHLGIIYLDSGNYVEIRK